MRPAQLCACGIAYWYCVRSVPPQQCPMAWPRPRGCRAVGATLTPSTDCNYDHEPPQTSTVVGNARPDRNVCVRRTPFVTHLKRRAPPRPPLECSLQGPKSRCMRRVFRGNGARSLRIRVSRAGLLSASRAWSHYEHQPGLLGRPMTTLAALRAQAPTLPRGGKASVP
jgi:hypothetical protein